MYSSQFKENERQADANYTSLELNLKLQKAGIVELEDAPAKTRLENLQQAFIRNLLCTQGKYDSIAALHDYYMALAYTIRERLIQRRIQTVKTYIKQDVKSVYYLL